MNTKYIVSTFTILLLALLTAGTSYQPAHAQDPVCRDAAGGVIPCPPTAEIPCGQVGGPACQPTREKNTPIPIPPAFTPTSTSLPIANPNDDGVTEDGWSGSCANAGPVNDLCLLKLINSCYDSHGSSVVSNPDDQGTVTVTCTLPLILEPTSLPITNPKEEDGTGGWTGKCSKYNTSSISKCVAGHLADCKFDGGTASQSTSDDGTVSVACKNTSNPAMINPTPLPIANAEADDNWVGHCSKTDGNLAECIQRYKCEDGLLVIKVDIYAGTYDFYCIPHVVDPQVVLPFAIPPDDGATGNWTGGCFGDDTDGCLNDMKAACDEEGGEYSEWYDDEGGVGAHCANSSESAPAPGGGFGGWLPWLGGGVAGILIGMLLVTLDGARSKALKVG